MRRADTMLEVVWFKRDLRVSDHAALTAAAARGPVLPLYIAEPGYWALPDTSARQWEFIAESLGELRDDLTRLGQPLVVRVGAVVALLERLHARHGIAHLWSHEETGNLWTFARDRAVRRFCDETGIGWTELPQMGVFRRLRDRDRWQAMHQRFMSAPMAIAPAAFVRLDGIDPGPIPPSTALGLAPDPCPRRQKGGRRAAVERLDSFFGGRGRNYRFEMSSPSTAAESCSRLSPHLACGTLSIREAMQRSFSERQRVANLPPEDRPVPLPSIDSFIARLHWHCHFIQKLESEPEIEERSVHPAFEPHRPRHGADDRAFQVWATGRTGFPFVDACMRSLIATGWINFRMRAMLMAFASYHLALDWRVTGLHLARLFTDYEPGIHWPQVQMQSGQTGINTPRIYNPVKQSRDQDPEGSFIRRWVPELAGVSVEALHEPWLFGAVPDYPPRIIDHEEAARAARERLTAVRRQAGFRETARLVHEKHGSRKRSASKGRRRSARSGESKVPVQAAQLDLDLG